MPPPVLLRNAVHAAVCADARSRRLCCCCATQTGRYPWGVGFYDMSDDSRCPSTLAVEQTVILLHALYFYLVFQ